MKRRISILLCAMLLLGIFAGCGQQSGGAGGTYRRLYADEVTTLNYLYTSSTNELRVAANVVDCLVEYDTYGIVQPALATSWDHNDDFTVWTFQIREGVKWVDHNGGEVGEVTAQDWVDAARYVNEAENDSGLQYMYDGIVLNAQEYFEQSEAIMNGEDYEGEPVTFDDVGVKALDTYVLEYTMEEPCPFFLTVLSYASYMPAYGPFLEEQGANFGLDHESLLYNGAYILSTYEPQRTRVLTKNDTYWDAENVFIDTLEFIYNDQATTLGPTMFQRGELEYAEVGADILEEWLSNDETKDLVRPSIVDISYSYFYAFNFEPRFDDALEPDNWIIAVNNENFRKALMTGLDRIKALEVKDPFTPASLLNNTITPVNFAVGAGKDYTEYDALRAFTERDSFDEAKAKEYAEIARAELEASGCTFPIKILMPYNPSTTNWDKECQVVEQQLENLLGTDFVDIIVEAGPATGFLSEVRRSGKFAFMKCNYGADFADPLTFTDAFKESNTYNFMHTDPESELLEIPKANKTASTQALTAQYYELLNKAKGITTDEAARYTAFAEAEAFLIEHAFVVPYSVDTFEMAGYVAEMLNPFESQFAPYGMAPYRYKGMKLLDEPMSMSDFQEAQAKWEEERRAAIAA